MEQQFGKTLPIEKPLFQQNYQKLSKVQTKKVKINKKSKNQMKQKRKLLYLHLNMIQS
jgi:hypothetical protein